MFFLFVLVHLLENVAVKQPAFTRCFEDISLSLPLFITFSGAGWRAGWLAPQRGFLAWTCGGNIASLKQNQASESAGHSKVIITKPLWYAVSGTTDIPRIKFELC